MGIFQCHLPANSANDAMEEDQANIEAILEQYDAYIVKQVHDRMHQHPHVIQADVFDLETDELIQRVRIKFWHSLQDKHIDYPKTYIKRIVHSEFIDMVRRLKPQHALALPVDEEGELYQGDMLIAPGTGMNDPASEYEEQVAVSSRIKEVVDAVLQLPERQQRAIICTLRDRVDDIDALAQEFKERKTDLNAWQWPCGHSEKLLLRASLAYARNKIGTNMKDAERIQALYLTRKKRSAVC
jgi:DNA-directed RNA polymerase specialized sigma24 family protein